MRIIHTLLILTGLALLFNSCGGDNLSIEESQLENEFETTKLTKITEEERVVLNEIMQSITSPLEISALMKESGADYNKGFLNDTENSNNYISSYQKAMNLGVYGADLAYCNIYKENTAGLPFLGAVKSLAEELKIGDFFDNATLLRLMKNNDSMDSLLTITTDNFEKINHHLQENNQSQVGALMLVGGWVEGVHLLLKVHSISPHKSLKERIGEQKIIMEQLLHVLSYYKNDEEIQSISSYMSKLNDVFKTVVIKRVEGESEMRVVDGAMHVFDKSYTEVIISDEQINQIEDKVNSLRDKIIK